MLDLRLKEQQILMYRGNLSDCIHCFCWHQDLSSQWRCRKIPQSGNLNRVGMSQTGKPFYRSPKWLTKQPATHYCLFTFTSHASWHLIRTRGSLIGKSYSSDCTHVHLRFSLFRSSQSPEGEALRSARILSATSTRLA